MVIIITSLIIIIIHHYNITHHDLIIRPEVQEPAPVTEDQLAELSEVSSENVIMNHESNLYIFCAPGDDAARHRRGGSGDQGQDAVSQPPLRH